MADLDAIWDDDAELASTSRPAVSDETRKSSEPLFIHGDESDAEMPDERDAPASGAADVELDEMFNTRTLDLIDTRAIQAQAEAAYRKEEARRPQKRKPAEERHQILPSSSPPPEGFDDGKADGKGEKEGEKKRRRPIVLDEGRLISNIGFPQLIEETKNFKVKGKGHEASDLNRLLNVYQFWAHRMYPRTQFNDTVERVEKLCHSNRMRNQLSMMRDAALGKPPNEDATDVSDSDDEGVGARMQPEDGAEATARVDTAPPPSSPPRSSPAASVHVAYASSSPRPASMPPDSSDAGDALMTDGTRSSAAPGDDEDAAMWAAIEEESNAAVAAKPASRPPVANDFDDDMDAAFAVLDELSGGAPAPAPPPAPPEFDHDMEDDFAVMDEMEHASSQPGGSSGPAPTPGGDSSKPSEPQAGPSPTKKRTTSDVEDEWDDADMYADD